ncbi:MAG: hypothetical protein INR64_12765 [Caulobacteraceae bacterium]|nr:hypothetical protein [Caulobacter sp.]
MKRIALFAAAAAAASLALAGCETATPYQPLGTGGAFHSGGFTDQQLEANRWTVTFSGNSLTSRQTVERYLLFRAAQLTVQQGYDWFTTVDRNTERKSDYVGYDDDFGYGGWGGYWGPRWGLYRGGFGGGWGYGYGGFGGGFGGFGGPWGGGPVDLQQVSRYTATSEILMGHGAKPAGDRRAFSARAVIDHLQSTIQYPEQKR